MVALFESASFRAGQWMCSRRQKDGLRRGSSRLLQGSKPGSPLRPVGSKESLRKGAAWQNPPEIRQWCSIFDACNWPVSTVRGDATSRPLIGVERQAGSRLSILRSVKNGNNDKRYRLVLELVDDDVGCAGDKAFIGIGRPAAWSHMREGAEAVDRVQNCVERIAARAWILRGDPSANAFKVAKGDLVDNNLHIPK